MASTTERRISTFKISASIKKGQAVKMGADEEHVAKATAATDKIIGTANHDVTYNAADGDEPLEVCMNGGGAPFRAGGVIALGDMLTADSNGDIVATTTSGNRVVGCATQEAVAGDVFGGEVALSVY